MTDTIHEMTSSVHVGVHLLWAYRHPDLAQRAIDQLFETWGNEATFAFAPFVSYEVKLIAIRNEDGARTPMDEVIKQKRFMETELEQAVAEFAEQQRATGGDGNAWVWKGNDKARDLVLAEMEAA